MTSRGSGSERGFSFVLTLSKVSELKSIASKVRRRGRMANFLPGIFWTALSLASSFTAAMRALTFALSPRSPNV